jgi:hypothetical protein
VSLRENLQDHIGSSGTFVARSNREPKPWPGCAPVDGPPAACPVGVDGERAVFDNEHRAAKRAAATASAAAADYRALNTGTRCPSAGSTRRIFRYTKNGCQRSVEAARGVSDETDETRWWPSGCRPK